MSADKFEQCFAWLMENEGGYVNNPADPGGETMCGITAKVARGFGYKGSMADIPMGIIKQIAKSLYWRDWMENAEMPLCFELFDAAFNVGPDMAAKLFQRSLGVVDDGVIGRKTMEAASSRTTTRLWIGFVAEVLRYRSSLTKLWPDFGRGWTNRSIKNLCRGAQLL